jgi:ABC-type nitrate/sulfonate/bicarbonate transport system substrate-binding protein
MAASDNEKLMIGWSAIAGSQAPFWITKEAGLFDKNGLDVTMIYVDGGSQATQALMSGDVPVVQVGGNAPVVARLRGADVTLIAGLLNVLAYSMVVSPEIKKPEDLKGKNVSVSRSAPIPTTQPERSCSDGGCGPISMSRCCKFPAASRQGLQPFKPSRFTAWSLSRR